MSNFVIHKEQVDRVLNPQRHDAPVPITLPNFRNINLPSLRELPISYKMITIPSNPTTLIREFPATLLHVVEGVEVFVEDIAELSAGVGREVAHLPHRASHEWKQLGVVLLLLVLVPLLVVGVVFFIPMQSVNEGLEGNHNFLFGISTFYEGLYLVAWVETFNFAQPQAKISVSSRFVSWIAGLVGCLVFDLLLAKQAHIFPIPFSILVSGMIAVIMVVAPVLYWLTPRLPSKIKTPFSGTIKLIVVYCASLCIVTLWAVGVNRLRHQPVLQITIGLLYAPIRFICKVVIASPVTTAQNPQRWIPLNLVVDMLFTRVQVTTFPFIDSYLTLLLLFSTEVITLAWRYYNGVDRLALWWNTIHMVRNKKCNSSHSFWKVSRGCFRAPILEVAELHLNLKEQTEGEHSERILRTLTGETAPVSFLSLHSDREDDATTASTTSVEKVEPADQDDVSYRDNSNSSTEYDSPTAGLLKRSVSFQINPTSHALEAITDIEAACEAADEQVLGISRRIDRHHSSILMIQEFEFDHDNDSVNFISVGDDIERQASDSSFNLDEVSFKSFELPQAHNTIHRHLSLATCSSTKSFLQENYCEQRVLFHVVDSTGAIVISTVTRISQQLCITMVRNLSSSSHLNQSFQISDERWARAQIFGWSYVFLMILLLSRLGYLFFSRIEGFTGRKLSLSRVMSYLFKDHFWFFFFWLLSSGVLVCASMVNHFGADFSFKFEWVGCPIGQVVWPECRQ
jgi:hypothetical protein